MLSSIEFNGLTLTTAFQPIFSVRDRRPTGFEALIRATDARGYTVMPADLFSNRGEAEMIALDRTCRTLHLRNFVQAEGGDRMLFINIDPVAAVSDARLARLFRSRISSFGLNPERICVEVLENCCADENLLVEAVEAYREIGVKIAMDDFGSGHSNFDRVMRLKPDLVKIDRSLLGRVADQDKTLRMLPSVIDSLHKTGAQVVIEGIEDAAEALMALQFEADYLQGFYFSLPRPDLREDPLAIRMLEELVRMRMAA
jgi:EAL domain-containing protein (putative c-di-GMP-specific phosphodiesterase class I)